MTAPNGSDEALPSNAVGEPGSAGVAPNAATGVWSGVTPEENAPVRPSPVMTGEPGFGLSEPSAAIASDTTLSSDPLETNSVRPSGVITGDVGIPRPGRTASPARGRATRRRRR